MCRAPDVGILNLKSWKLIGTKKGDNDEDPLVIDEETPPEE